MNRIASSLSTLAVLAFAGSAHAIKVKGTAPQFTFKAGGIPTAVQTELNNQLATSFDATIAQAQDKVKNFNEQKDLAQGFGNANAYSSNSGTLMGYQNYDLFAVSAGMMLGFQAPSTDFSYYGKIMDDINDKGDLYAGIGMGVSFLNVGVNAGFLLPGLYLNAKYGGMSQEFGDEFAFDFLVWGVGANYRILDSKSLAGIVKWRGISVGSGIYHQSNKIETHIESDEIKNTVNFREQSTSGKTGTELAVTQAALDSLGFTTTTPNLVMTMGTGFDMGLDISTTSIPIEASTAVSLLFGVINVSAGLGTDLVFGTSEIILKGNSTNKTATPDVNKVSVSDAAVVIDGGSDNSPSFLRPRVMAGVGMGMGPVKLDIPLYWYLNSGVAAGLTAAVVW